MTVLLHSVPVTSDEFGLPSLAEKWTLPGRTHSPGKPSEKLPALFAVVLNHRCVSASSTTRKCTVLPPRKWEPETVKLFVDGCEREMAGLLFTGGAGGLVEGVGVAQAQAEGN